MQATTSSAHEIVTALRGRWQNGQGMAHCPVHNDKTPSLSVAEKEGSVLVKCHAGCNQNDIIAALRERNLWNPDMPHQRITTRKSSKYDDELDAYEKQKRAWVILRSREPATRTPVEVYLRSRGLNVSVPKCIYLHPALGEFGHGNPRPAMLATIVSADDKLVGVHVTALRRNGRGKARCKSPRKTYGTLRNRGAAIRLYPAGKVLVIAEGIETALAAHEITGLPSWSAISASNMPGVVVPIEVKEVIIAADNDKAGIRAANKLAKRLAKEGKVVRVAIPETEGSDWLDALNDPSIDIDVLRRSLVEADVVEKQEEPVLRVVSAEYLCELEFPPRVNLLHPWLPEQGIAMIHAPRGVGKTYLALSIALAVTRGGTVLGWRADNPNGVLYLDGEMPASSLQARIRELGTLSNGVAAALKIGTPDIQDGRIMPDLATEEGKALVDRQIDDSIRLIIVDSITTLVRTGEENTAEDWLPVQNWALRHRARGISVLFIHHSGKSGRQRGTSRREDVMDSVLNLRRPEGYSAEDGAVFEIHYEKARGFYGDDARPFEARLTKDDTGAIAWERRDLNDRPLDLVVKMMNDGKLQKDIAAELGVSDARVSQLVKRGREAGLIGSTDKSQRQRTA